MEQKGSYRFRDCLWCDTRFLGCDEGTFLEGFVRDSEGRMMPNASITLIVSRIRAKLSRCKTARTVTYL